ncbi:hypothetical protein [Rhodopseudomonas palustris]|uniref:hypothetical protein n=1 Tax=Rhodopseudomonas palustris TaxID=1076 RepID=UPI0011B05FF4|nr:hypothetical protein [Rhodopseudomonas palustris]
MLNLKFDFDGDKLVVKGLPPHLELRGINYPSKSIAEIKHLTVASANMTAAKFYMNSLQTATRETDAHLYDAALLAAVVKYGSVFKPDSKGRAIDPVLIFTNKLKIINQSLFAEPIFLDDPDLQFRKHHQSLITLRDKMIAHDDRFVGTSECFAALDANLNCEHVIGLTQRTTVYSALKPDLQYLPMCIDIVLTWLAEEKEHFCQLATDEINNLDLKVRQKFPEPIFEQYAGLSDADERKARQDPYWEYDWASGEKRIVNRVKGHEK